jgi:hypothetical protein
MTVFYRKGVFFTCIFIAFIRLCMICRVPLRMFTARVLGKRRPNGCPVASNSGAVRRPANQAGIALLEGEDNDPVEWENGACFSH